MSKNKKEIEEIESELKNTENNEILSQDSEKIIKIYEKKLSDYDEKLQRALADYQNLERRTQLEISQRVSSKTNDLLLNFINIYEDFIRAENSLSKEKIDTTGIQAVIKNMENLIKILYKIPYRIHKCYKSRIYHVGPDLGPISYPREPGWHPGIPGAPRD